MHAGEKTEITIDFQVVKSINHHFMLNLIQRTFGVDSYSFIFLLGQGNKLFAELLGELDVVPLNDVAATDLVHDVIPVN